MKERGGRKIRLALYRKRAGIKEVRQPPRPVLFLVHGSSASALPSFDLTVPGRGPYSLMDAFAAWGFDVWTMDHEGYGRSSRTDGNSDIASGVADLSAATQVVARETGTAQFCFMGESSGGLRAAAFAMTAPDRVQRLVLSAVTYTGKGSPTLKQRAEQLEYYRTHARRPRGREMLLSIFSRDKPGTTDPVVADAFADAEMVFGNTVPTGTYLDMTANLPVVDPAKMTSPVLIARGEFDGISSLEDLVALFTLLPNMDKQLAIIPGAAHTLTLARNRQLFWHTMLGFLTMPQRQDL
ncbi:MAG: alpha/beta fold hydrolase [Acetobacteraceae bacterium]|nr:alpha/beta fold hydrolase [Acetobacteraceae bacterium]